VIYFFLKDQQFVQCEVYPGRPHVFTVIEPGGVEHSELYSSSAELQARYDALRLGLNEEGWWRLRRWAENFLSSPSTSSAYPATSRGIGVDRIE